MLTPFDFSALSEAFGAEVAWYEDRGPSTKRPALRHAADALALTLPDPYLSGRLPVVLEATRRIAALYRGQVPLMGVLPGPCILPALLFGLDRWVEMILFQEQTARQVTEYLGGFFLRWAGALLEAGADFLMVSEGMAASEVAPRGIFQTQFLPHLRAMFRQLPAPKLVSGAGGSLHHTLDLLSGLEGVVGVMLGAKDDLTASRRIAGPGLTLVGNLDSHTLVDCAPKQVRAACLERLRSAVPAGPFILAHSGTDLPLNTPPENLKALRGSVHCCTPDSPAPEASPPVL